MSESTELDTAHPRKRDLLGQFCFYLHFVVMIFIVTGWVLPWRAALAFYLVFIPGVFVQWRFNSDTCILNNTENWLRTGKWRDRENNPEEGAWLLTLANSLTGIAFTPRLIDFLTYSVLALVWLLALAHILGKF
jgi:hypothetical protein